MTSPGLTSGSRFVQLVAVSKPTSVLLKQYGISSWLFPELLHVTPVLFNHRLVRQCRSTFIFGLERGLLWIGNGRSFEQTHATSWSNYVYKSGKTTLVDWLFPSGARWHGGCHWRRSQSYPKNFRLNLRQLASHSAGCWYCVKRRVLCRKDWWNWKR